MKRDRDNLGGIGPLGVVARVNAAIGLECARDAAVIVHDQVGILPVTAQLQARTSIAAEEASVRPVRHAKTDGFAVGREIQMLAHVADQVEPEALSARSAEIGNAFKVRAATPFNVGVEVYHQNVVAAFGVQGSPTLPGRNDVKFTPKKEAPGFERGGDGQHEDCTQGKDRDQLGERTQAAVARNKPFPSEVSDGDFDL